MARRAEDLDSHLMPERKRKKVNARSSHQASDDRGETDTAAQQASQGETAAELVQPEYDEDIEQEDLALEFDEFDSVGDEDETVVLIDQSTPASEQHECAMRLKARRAIEATLERRQMQEDLDYLEI